MKEDNEKELAIIKLIKREEFEAAEKLIKSLPEKERLSVISGAARYEHGQDERSKHVLEYTMTHAYMDKTGKITIHAYDKASKTYITFKVQDDKLITTSAAIVNKQGIKEADISKVLPAPFSSLEKFSKGIVRIGVTATELLMQDLQNLLEDVQTNSKILKNGETSIAHAMHAKENTQAITSPEAQTTVISESNLQNDFIENGAIAGDESRITASESQTT